MGTRCLCRGVYTAGRRAVIDLLVSENTGILWSEALAWLRDLRIKADYLEDIVDLEEASEALEVARSLVGRTLKER